jgi:hypothetical protein
MTPNFDKVCEGLLSTLTGIGGGAAVGAALGRQRGSMPGGFGHKYGAAIGAAGGLMQGGLGGVAKMALPSFDTKGGASRGLLSMISGTKNVVPGGMWTDMGLGLGAGLAGGQKASALQKAVQAGQVTQQGAERLMASKKPQRSRGKKLLKGSKTNK